MVLQLLLYSPVTVYLYFFMVRAQINYMQSKLMTDYIVVQLIDMGKCV